MSPRDGRRDDVITWLLDGDPSIQMEHPPGDAGPRGAVGSPLTSTRMHRLVASVFGAGLLLGRLRGSDAGSGTVGSLVALPFALLIGQAWGWPGQLIAAVVVTVIAFWSTAGLSDAEGDAGWIVIDEAAGTFVATIGLLGWPALAGFVVFRLADILKTPFPGVHQADSMSGPYGIAADDTVAGLYGLAVGHLVNATLF